MPQTNAERQAVYRKRRQAEAEKQASEREKAEKRERSRLLREIENLKAERQENLKNAWIRGILDTLFCITSQRQTAQILSNFYLSRNICREAAAQYFDFCVYGSAVDVFAALEKRGVFDNDGNPKVSGVTK